MIEMGLTKEKLNCRHLAPTRTSNSGPSSLRNKFMMFRSSWFLTQWDHTDYFQSIGVFPQCPALCSQCRKMKALCSSSLESPRCQEEVPPPPDPNQPSAVSFTCKNNHSETPAGVSQHTAPQDYLLIVEGVLTVLPRENSREFI